MQPLNELTEDFVHAFRCLWRGIPPPERKVLRVFRTSEDRQCGEGKHAFGLVLVEAKVDVENVVDGLLFHPPLDPFFDGGLAALCGRDGGDIGK